MNADVDRGAHRQPFRINNRNRISGAVADDHRGPIRRNARQARATADMKRRCNGAAIQIKNRNVIGTGIGNVGAMSVRRNIDEVRVSVHPNRANHFILLGVNYADVRRACVDDINFITLGIRGQSGGIGAHLQRANRAKASQINNRNCVAHAVADVCELAVERAVVGESALMKVVPSRRERKRDEDRDEEEFAQNLCPGEGKRLSDVAHFQLFAKLICTLIWPAIGLQSLLAGSNFHVYTVSIAFLSK